MGTGGSGPEAKPELFSGGFSSPGQLVSLVRGDGY